MGRCRRCHSATAIVAIALFGIAIGAESRAEGPAPSVVLPAGWTLRPSGYLQTDAGLYRQDSEDQLDTSTGKPLNEERFTIRRAHLRLDAAWRFLDGGVEIEGTTGGATSLRLFAAEVSARWPEPPGAERAWRPPLAMLTVGLLRTPFGAEVQERDVERLFLERSAAARALFPGVTDLGARAQGGWGPLRWQLAVMNGHPSGEKAFPQLDPTASKDWLGRLGVDVLAGGRVRIVAGASGLYGTGFHAGTPGTKDRIEWRDDNGDGVVQPSELHPLLGVAAAPSENFGRHALGVDARVAVAVPRLGALSLSGELVWATNLDRALFVADPISTGRDLRELGWHVALTQELGPYALVGVRFDRYDPDADAQAQLGAASVPVDRSLRSWALAVAVQFPPWARLILEYDRNQNALGIDDGGHPTTLGSDALTARAQLAF